MGYDLTLAYQHKVLLLNICVVHRQVYDRYHGDDFHIVWACIHASSCSIGPKMT